LNVFFDTPSFDHGSDHLCDPAIEAEFCIGGKYAHHYTFQYFQQFVENYRQVPKFAFLDFLAAHEVPPSPFLTRLQTLDEYLERGLKFLLESSKLEGRESVVMILGDHGLHRSWYAYSSAGTLEHKLPLLQVIMPNSLLAKKSHNPCKYEY